VSTEIERRATSEPFKNRTRNSNFKEGSTVKENASSTLLKGLRRSAIAIVAIGVAAAGPAVNATPNSNKAADNPANVVAHVQLSGGPVTQNAVG
jgi:hypothetical protein